MFISCTQTDGLRLLLKLLLSSGNTDQSERRNDHTKRDRFRDDRNTREMKETPTAKKSSDVSG